ncbi:hypothetical protein BB561_005370 [Smittium simulii]|uniref:Bifunctional chorismate mutase/prephenate dehydratase n=1 Tax=Smittium simulii TaxID=133385 RepID=A0A2T9YAP9_9FUNG|nr:hypothetical protein BB561_005370 [Smittium simulii]
MDFDDLRSEIAGLDQQLVDILNQRAELSVAIGKSKKKAEKVALELATNGSAATSSIYIPEQEKSVYNRVKSLNNGPISDNSLYSIYREIMSASISLQDKVQVAFLGPIGTFCHQAAKKKFGDSVSFVPYSNITDVFEAVETSKIGYGVVPIENSIFGSVPMTLDSFNSIKISKSTIILSEIYLPLQQTLLSNSELKKITKIYSHPMAFGQCQPWLKNNLPDVQCVEVNSTALGAQISSLEPFSAAIANSMCSSLYNINILEQNISTRSDNTTRFLVISRSQQLLQPKNADKVSIIFTLNNTKSNSIQNTLQLFDEFKFTIISINSRPAGSCFEAGTDNTSNWSYTYFIDALISQQNSSESVNLLIDGLQKYCTFVKLLGLYFNEN